MHAGQAKLRMVGVAALVAPIVVATGCASYNVRPRTVPASSAWGASGTVSNALISATKYASCDDPCYPFGRDLNVESLLPIHIMITNHGVGDLVVRTSHFVLADDSTQYRSVNVDTMLDRVGFSPEKRYFYWALGIGVPTLGIGGGLE